MDSALLILTASGKETFANALSCAHALSGNRPFFVDFPGIDNPGWQAARINPLGRVMVIYSDLDFAQQVEQAIRGDRANRHASIIVGIDDLVMFALAEIAAPSVRLTRKCLRHIGARAAEKKAKRLHEYLARKGVTPQTPIVPREGGIVVENGRIKALCGGRYTDQILTIRSGKGHNFTLWIERHPVQEACRLPTGRRDAYGFGGVLPNTSERKILSTWVGEPVL